MRTLIKMIYNTNFYYCSGAGSFKCVFTAVRQVMKIQMWGMSDLEQFVYTSLDHMRFLILEILGKFWRLEITLSQVSSLDLGTMSTKISTCFPVREKMKNSWSLPIKIYSLTHFLRFGVVLVPSDPHKLFLPGKRRISEKNQCYRFTNTTDWKIHEQFVTLNCSWLWMFE